MISRVGSEIYVGLASAWNKQRRPRFTIGRCVGTLVVPPLRTAAALVSVGNRGMRDLPTPNSAGPGFEASQWRFASDKKRTAIADRALS